MDKTRERAIARLKEAEKESWSLLDAMARIVEQYQELGTVEMVQQLNPLSIKYYEVCGEIKGLKLALGLT